MTGKRRAVVQSAAAQDAPADEPASADLLARIAEVRRRRRAAGAPCIVYAAPPPSPPVAVAGSVDGELVRKALLGAPYAIDGGEPPPINPVRRLYLPHELARFHDADFVAVAYLAILKRLPFEGEARRRYADLRCGMGRGMLLTRLRFSPEGRQFGVWVPGLSLWALVDFLRLGPRRWSRLRRGVAMTDR